jgi:N utilization substance protein B
MPEAATPSYSRRLAREVAFQALYMNVVAGLDPDEAITTAESRHILSTEAKAFIADLVNGVIERADRLDEEVEPYLATGWTLARLVISDLICLRLAAYELLYMPDMPPKVSISQAVDLAKRFGTKESGSFVNGVLGSLLPNTAKAEFVAPIVIDLEPEDLPEPADEPEEEGDDQEEPVKVGTWVLKIEESTEK